MGKVDRKPEVRRGLAGGAYLTLVVAAVFIAILFALWHWGHMPLWIPLGHLAVSLVAFAMYWVDKAKARSNRWRISEKTLHILEFFGGWPGALVAQQLFRHKNQKKEYQVAFWLIVLVNLAVLGLWLWQGFPDPKTFSFLVRG
jgi:uncharacterized membrane protein YsdA (DUF1294 family)